MQQVMSRDAARTSSVGWPELLLLAGALLFGTLLGEFARSPDGFGSFVSKNMLMGIMAIAIADRTWRTPPRLAWSTLSAIALVVGLVGFSWLYCISA